MILSALTEIERRAERATGGPWDHDDSGETISTVNGPDCIIACEVTDEQGISSPENAAFIAAARTDVPKLCTALRIAFEDGLSDEVVDRIEEVLRGDASE